MNIVDSETYVNWNRRNTIKSFWYLEQIKDDKIYEINVSQLYNGGSGSKGIFNIEITKESSRSTVRMILDALFDKSFINKTEHDKYKDYRQNGFDEQPQNSDNKITLRKIG